MVQCWSCRLRPVCLHVAERCTAWQGWLTRPSRLALSLSLSLYLLSSLHPLLQDNSPLLGGYFNIYCYTFITTGLALLTTHSRRRASSVMLGGWGEGGAIYSSLLPTLHTVVTIFLPYSLLRVQWVVFVFNNNLSEFSLNMSTI